MARSTDRRSLARSAVRFALPASATSENTRSAAESESGTPTYIADEYAQACPADDSVNVDHVMSWKTVRGGSRDTDQVLVLFDGNYLYDSAGPGRQERTEHLLARLRSL